MEGVTLHRSNCLTLQPELKVIRRTGFNPKYSSSHLGGMTLNRRLDQAFSISAILAKNLAPTVTLHFILTIKALLKVYSNSS